MGFVSCLEDQQKRFESDCHILHRDIQSGRADGESAKKDALRLLGDAQVCWAKVMKYVDELTLPEFDNWEGAQELRDRCSSLEGVVSRVEQESSRISDLAGLLFLHNQVLQEQLKQERIRCRQFERDFEKMGREDFGRLVEPFLTKGMFAKHAKR
ncbi:hypothetical protein ACP86_16500 [Marinobacter sp. CP1]|uniref:hypothetical protein n=1 Tax=unclassified Marinobacter TaxID=83889 RepID=UPI00069FD040|nr:MULTISPECIES: hypothetical protein [unclassified Marinobacter]AKV97626.1 hypothetical protein ACP86_16500 [Marinobacter sp. CP1]